MLRITQNAHSAGAKSYYSTADYYSEGQELTGHWQGEAANRLGLEGNVKQAEWDALCDNQHPQTGKRLTGRTDTDRTVGYDFNFHVPKSVSLLYATTRDERLLDAFREAVDGTMHAMEAEMATRVRKGGRNENRRTANMVWGEFVHFTARPVDGVPDPHLHAHCFVFNTTWDDQEQAWKAGQFRDLKRDAPYFEAVFHSRLAHRLHDLGLPIERTKKGWELAGVNKELIEKFSRRTALIEEKAREKGIDDAEEKSELGAKTRERKQKELSFPDLQESWRARMSPQEIEVLKDLERRLGDEAEPRDGNASARAIDHAISHVFERRSVVPERQLLRTALWHSVGQAAVERIQEQVHDRAARDELIVGDRHGRRMVTTREVLGEERRMIDFAKQGRGACRPFVQRHDQFQRDWLNADQKQAVKHLVESRDRIIMVRGAAGVGKTTLMQEAVETIEASGTKVFAFAPSAAASRGVLRGEGFKDADTVARLLFDEKLQQQVAGQLIWIDEAGLLGTKHMAAVFSLADRLDARVLLSGDRRQHGSVERGAVLRLLEEEAGITPAEVKEIQRQAGAYKAAVKSLSEGNFAEGFDRLDRLGWVREIPVGQRYKQLAADYLETVTVGKTALVVSPTHFEADRLTDEIRQALRAAGKLASGEREFMVLESANLTAAERADAVNYHSGDILQFHQNAKGYQRGQRLAVNGSPLPLDQSARFQLFHSSTLRLAPGDLVRITQNGMTADGHHRLNNGALYRVKRFGRDGNLELDNGWVVGKQFGHLAYGYSVTSHASQGKTVDRVLIAQSSASYPASSREQFYVSVSRGRQQATIYTHNKQALREAISQSDERLTATEFMNSAVLRQADLQRERSHEVKRELEGPSYER